MGNRAKQFSMGPAANLWDSLKPAGRKKVLVALGYDPSAVEEMSPLDWNGINGSVRFTLEVRLGVEEVTVGGERCR